MGAGTGTLPVNQGQYGGMEMPSTLPRRTPPGVREAEKARTKRSVLTSPSFSLSQEATGVYL